MFVSFQIKTLRAYRLVRHSKRENPSPQLSCRGQFLHYPFSYRSRLLAVHPYIRLHASKTVGPCATSRDITSIPSISLSFWFNRGSTLIFPSNRASIPIFLQVHTSTYFQPYWFFLNNACSLALHSTPVYTSLHHNMVFYLAIGYSLWIPSVEY